MNLLQLAVEMTATARSNVFRQSESNPIVPMACRRVVNIDGMDVAVVFSLDDMSDMDMNVKVWHLSVQDSRLKYMPPQKIIDKLLPVFFDARKPVLELPAHQFPPEARMDVTRQFVQPA